MLDHLGIRSVVPVGHSQGAYVAREMLLTQPERVTGIVTEDSGALGKIEPETIAQTSTDHFDAPTRGLYEKWRETLEFIGRPWDYPSDYNVMRLLSRRCRIRDEDEWKYQQVPDPDDAVVPVFPRQFIRVIVVGAQGQVSHIHGWNAVADIQVSIDDWR